MYCQSDGCDQEAFHWITNGEKSWYVCEDCKDEMTSEPHNMKELVEK